MIDTNELRRLAQAAISKMSTLDPEFVSSVTPLAVLELLDRLEAAESDALEQARLNGMGSEREAALMAKLEAAERERDWHAERCEDAMNECAALRAKIARMEQQEPVAWMLNCQTLGGDTGWILSWTQSGAGLCNRLSGEENEKKLYVLPGAKGE